MRLEEHEERDDKKVWLSKNEVDLLLSKAQDTKHELAIGLGVRAGLRAAEIVDVTPQDIVEHEETYRVRVEEGKGEKYRETPIPSTIFSTAKAYSDIREEDKDEPLIDVSTRTIERWVSKTADRCLEETGDEGWRFLSPHDLRRTWGTILVAENVEPGMIMSWGGWENWRTFREHYLGAYSPEMERKQIEKVPWL